MTGAVHPRPDMNDTEPTADVCLFLGPGFLLFVTVASKLLS